MLRRQLAAKIVDESVDFLKGRRGFDYFFEVLTPNVKQELLTKWIDVVEVLLAENTELGD
jgi:hypothetical protein